MWAPALRLRIRPPVGLGPFCRRRNIRAQSTMSDVLLKRLDNNTNGPFDPDSMLLIFREMPASVADNMLIKEYANIVMGRLKTWTIAFGRMNAQAYADIINEARMKNVRDGNGQRLDEAMLDALVQNMDSLTVRNISYYCTALSRYDMQCRSFWQNAARLICNRNESETFNVVETVSLFNSFRINGVANSVDERIFTQLGEITDRLLPKLEMNHIPSLIAGVCRVPLPPELCSRLLDRLILRWVDMMRSWEPDVDIEERRRSLVHSVLISLASPESMENLRIESTLETFAMEVSQFMSQRFEHYRSDGLVMSLWALHRVERSAKMPLTSLEQFFDEACGCLANVWGLLEDNQSLSLQRLLQLSTVILQKHPSVNVVELRQRVQSELTRALIHANVDHLLRAHSLWRLFVRRDSELDIAMRTRAAELVAEAEVDYDREDILAAFPEIQSYERETPTAPLPLPEPIQLADGIDQDFDKLSAEELVGMCETLAEMMCSDASDVLPKKLVEAGILVLEKLEEMSLHHICQVLICFAASNIETKTVVDPLVSYLLQHERLTARQGVDIAECCALLRVRTPEVVNYFQGPFDQYANRLSAKTVCRYLRAQARLSIPLSQVYLQRVAEITPQLVPLPKEDLFFLLHALLLQGAIPSEDPMLGQIFFWLYSRSQRADGVLSAHERGLLAQYVFLLCTTEDGNFQMSNIYPEVQRFVESQVGAPGSNLKSRLSDSTLKFRHDVGRALDGRKIPNDVDVRWGPGGLSVDLWCANQAWLLDGPECFFRHDGTELLYVPSEQRRAWLLSSCQKSDVWQKALPFCEGWRPEAERPKGTLPPRRLNFLQWAENPKYWIDQIIAGNGRSLHIDENQI